MKALCHRCQIHFPAVKKRRIQVLTTFDTPNATGLPLNDVKQTGQKVEFGMRIAHGSFQGTLNKDGTELAGQFTHEANSTPLTLQKKSVQPAK
jgi:hypothetical protein